MSFAQQRLWFLYKLEGPSVTYNVPLARRLEGPFDENALRAALQDVVNRHESLRTIFPDENDVPQQKILDADIAIPAVVVQDIQESELSSCLDAAAGYAFNLSSEMPLRIWLFRLAPACHVLLLLVHHIACDGGSLAPLWRDLAAAYSARSRGELPNWAPLPVQYADYALWQKDLLGDEADPGSTISRQLDYWRHQLEGSPEELELPKDRPRPEVSSYRGETVDFQIQQEVGDKLRKLAHNSRTSLYMVMQTTAAALMSRLGAGDDIPLGAAIAGRTDDALNQLIGFFVNTLVLRTDTSGNPSLRVLLERVREHALSAYQHQDLPFEYLVEALNPLRSLNRHPLFQVMVTLQNNELAILSLPGLKVTPEHAGTHSAKFDLSFSLTEQTAADGVVDGISGTVGYATDLFERGSVERIASRFVRMLEAIALDPEQPIETIDLLNPLERHQLLVEWNTPASYSSHECVHELFEEQVRRRPQGVAVVFEGEQLTYAELNARANQLAHYLRKLGVKPDSLVGLCVERSLEMVVGLLAVLKAGGCYVPMDPSYPVERLSYMLEDSAPLVLLTQGEARGSLPGMAESVKVVDLGDAELWSKERKSNPKREAVGLKMDHLAYVIYTSGSTGRPKGVMVEHANVVRLLHATEEWFRFSENDVWTLFHSYAFDFSVWEIWGALVYGGRLVVVPRKTAQSPHDFYKLLCDANVTVLNQTPSAFRQLIAAQAQSKKSHELRYVIFGGEALEVSTLKPWYEQNPHHPAQLVNMYGITETTVHVTYRPLAPVDTERRGGSPIGCRIPDLRIYILDGSREPVGVGVTGELYVSGAGVARGYLNRPELTAERFMRDPFAGADGARMYRTGDVGRWLGDGTIEFLGRNDDQVKIRGFRIELGEIEARLAECEGVKEAVVVAREGGGGGEKRLVAYYTCRKSGGGKEEEGELEVAAEQLRAHVAKKLPEYMVPAAYVRMEKIPLTRNGKLDRKSLPEPEGDAYVQRGYEAPKGEMEERVARIWGEVLKVERVGR
ncbi:MAG TPA: amino acid adenylation domain-containing protein, partial [Candidatus Angelobacter sp.]